jgi:hypothetical protein
MQVELLRKDSTGIAGTYANARHHAQECLPLVKALEAQVQAFGFKTWKQGHNVHLFETHDGRKFDIVPYAVNGKYKGLELRLRESRSKAHRLAVITELSEIPTFVIILQALAKVHQANERGLFRHQLN